MRGTGIRIKGEERFEGQREKGDRKMQAKERWDFEMFAEKGLGGTQ